ncbi:hypothetical protein FIU82_06475 [Pseudoalteromonas sp. THAF3]|uniref:Uncharacterized protein n=1 Tax=Pseudoalteromonas ruthenica TaxID=151081 RepID=A0A5S3ZAS1_9GAMM|nr:MULTISPECIES: energy-coupling factor ABC transporter permease [Pseudoalteromonas]MCG7544427.1 hypothetical protein [Pseudoalteromonas sp. MM17-2]QFU04656.1 hypothetical protein FIU82_06475 [Pseudoalteromonas sp. THAF3]RZF86497.1 hypothetical protein EXT46_01925 [Pseudoalteromonas sp. CO325X]TMP88736.1 hypothetical protein CWC05_01565 [Pseudoalteromonas ruthenica]
MSYIILAIILALSIDKASLTGLIAHPARQKGLFACALVLALLWRIKAGIFPGLDIHILGVTAVTLILGWRLATLASVLATALLLAFSVVSIESAATFIILTALIPIYFSYLLFIVVYHALPRHLFIYIFVCSFLCAALANCLKIFVGAGYFWFIGSYDWVTLTENYLFLSALIWFPEAMLNGMAMTLMVIYRPHWVRTFYDKEYLSQ